MEQNHNQSSLHIAPGKFMKHQSDLCRRTFLSIRFFDNCKPTFPPLRDAEHGAVLSYRSVRLRLSDHSIQASHGSDVITLAAEATVCTRPVIPSDKLIRIWTGIRPFSSHHNLDFFSEIFEWHLIHVSGNLDLSDGTTTRFMKNNQMSRQCQTACRRRQNPC